MDIVTCRYCESPNPARAGHLFCTQCAAPLPVVAMPQVDYAPTFAVNDTMRGMFDLSLGFGSAFLEVVKGLGSHAGQS